DPGEALDARLPDADGVVTSFPIPDGRLAGLPKLCWVHVMSAGVERMLTSELAAAEHVALTASKGPMGQLMAEHVVALMLALARNLPGFGRDQAEHRWRRMMAEGRHVVELVGKTIAILAMREVAGYVARISRVGLGMRVLGMARTRRTSPPVDRYFDRVELHAALAEADVVSLSMPVTPMTHHILDRTALAALKPTAYLIN